MRMGIVLSIIIWGALGVLMTGCAGAKLFGEFGMTRIDERQQSERTYDRKVGLRCIFTNCDAEGEVKGS